MELKKRYFLLNIAILTLCNLNGMEKKLGEVGNISRESKIKKSKFQIAKDNYLTQAINTNGFTNDLMEIIAQYANEYNLQLTLDKTNGGHTNVVRSVIYSPCGKYLASGSDDGSVKIYDVENKKIIATLDKTNGGHTDIVISVIYSPCGKYLVSGSYDRSVKVFQIRYYQLLSSVK